LRLISFDGKVGILRCINGHVEATRAALATVHTIAGIRCGIRVIGVGGTILAATEKYIPQMSYVAAEIGKRIDLGEISGWIKRQRCSEIDIEPDVRREGSDTRYLGLTYFDLDGGCVDADGTSDGL
jgi:ribonuclease P/MRP protein subunit POP5